MSGKLYLPLPDGTSFALPPDGDVYTLDPSLCADFPGHGMRPDDEYCIRCGQRETLSHRQNIRACRRPCFLCDHDPKAHLGNICPKLSGTVSIWWWRLRGWTGGSMPGLPLFPPKLPNKPHPELLSAPPIVMLNALESSMDNSVHATIKAQLQAAERFGVGANKLLRELGRTVCSLPKPMLGKDMLEGLAHAVLLSLTMVKESNRLLLSASGQLRNTMVECTRVSLSSNSPSTSRLSNRKMCGYENKGGMSNLQNVSAMEGRRIYIGNLASDTSEVKIREFLNGFSVEAVTFPGSSTKVRSGGYAFVVLSTPTEAEKAIKHLNGMEILGRKVEIQHVRPNVVRDDANELSDAIDQLIDGTKQQTKAKAILAAPNVLGERIPFNPPTKKGSSIPGLGLLATEPDNARHRFGPHPLPPKPEARRYDLRQPRKRGRRKRARTDKIDPNHGHLTTHPITFGQGCNEGNKYVRMGDGAEVSIRVPYKLTAVDTMQPQ